MRIVALLAVLLPSAAFACPMPRHQPVAVRAPQKEVAEAPPAPSLADLMGQIDGAALVEAAPVIPEAAPIAPTSLASDAPTVPAAAPVADHPRPKTAAPPLLIAEAVQPRS